MYAYFKGMIEDKASDHVIIDVNNIGYYIKISAYTFDALPAVGQAAKIYTYTAVREDDISLYGFITRDELEFFKILINVNGIGPKAGLNILSVMSVDALRMAIVSGDAKLIAKAPGIGAKTAQRIILDLKDKVSLEDTINSNLNSNRSNSTLSNTMQEAIEALAALGYSSTEALKAVNSVESASDLSVEQLLKEAFKYLI